MAIDCRPEEQKRLMVTPEVVIGSPASSDDSRAMLPPPAWMLPTKTSSTASFSTPERWTAWSMVWAIMVMAGVMLNPPRPVLARPVRAYETTTASRILVFSLRFAGTLARTRGADKPRRHDVDGAVAYIHSIARGQQEQT